MPPDRRPIAARNLPIFIALARALARANISANFISITGMIGGLAAGLALFLTDHALDYQRPLFLLAAFLIQFRLLCNMLDGMVAIESGRQSPLGELYNEVPDRISDLATLIGLGYAARSSIELGYLAGALAVLVAYGRAAARVAGAPQDFRGPMAKQQRMFIVTVVALYAAFAPSGWQPTIPNDRWSVPAAALAIISVGCIITMLRRLARAASILRAS